MKLLFSTGILFLSISLFSQKIIQPPFTPATERIKSFEQRKVLETSSLVSNIPFESIGPSVFSGRVSDVAVWEEDPSHFYVGYSSGGLWKTENNGISFEPIFDKEMVMTIGDIAVNWEENLIWVGTGEVNSSRSSYSGVGMYKSSDGGKTWEHKGLGESHHIGRIILHPTKPKTLWVAVLGHLYSPNQERGVYKTTDGGETWQRVLFVNQNAGAVDLIIDPSDPNILYAGTWERERRGWNFVESGEGSGIYKSTDGGENWIKLNTENSGFPNGKGVGRIGLTIHKKNGKEVIYAILDNYFRRPKEDKKEKSNELAKEDFRKMTKEAFLKLEEKAVKKYLDDNNFGDEYSFEKIKELIENEEIKPVALVEYVENANTLLFDTPVIGTEVYKSEDGGKTWKKTHEDYLDNVYYSYGYYFGQIRVSPTDSDKIFIMGVPVLRSDDGGKTWEDINAANVHSDHHALWVNPNREGHLILGNDGGINISYDDGENWNKCNTPPVGQFYYIAVDMKKPYRVYGGLQDNGVWVGPNNYKASDRWQASGKYPYKRIMGGDGMQVAVDTRDNATIYTGFQFGNYFRINEKTGNQEYITPKHKLGERPLRWNWQTPIHLSNHNQDILYMGSNKLHRSFNQGDDFEEISDDLTKGGIKGDVPFGTLSTIHESPLKFGLLYTGSDDGLVYISKDVGNFWQNISVGLPENLWVSRIQASKYEEGRVYVVLNGYRWDDFRALIYVSENYGQTWKKISKDLPLEPVNVIKEDPENREILYAGTDHALYVSLNRGESWMVMNQDLPAVAVHDVVIHPREREILVGTHGRSIYKANVKHLQKLTAEILANELEVFDIQKVKYSSRWGSSRNQWTEAREPEIEIPLYSKSNGKVEIFVKMGYLTLYSFEKELEKGINYLNYNGEISKDKALSFERLLNEKLEEGAEEIKVEKSKNGKYYLKSGTYEIIFKKSDVEVSKNLKIE